MSSSVSSAAIKSDPVNELAMMYWEAERFLDKLQSEVKTITEVYEGRELLTPATLLRCNVATMIIHQLTANIARLAAAISQKMSTASGTPDSQSWVTLSSQLFTESRSISTAAIARAKEISEWASVKIDGTVYSNNRGA